MVMRNSTHIKNVKADIDQLEQVLADKRSLLEFLEQKEIANQNKAALLSGFRERDIESIKK